MSLIDLPASNAVDLLFRQEAVQMQLDEVVVIELRRVVGCAVKDLPIVGETGNGNNTKKVILNRA